MESGGDRDVIVAIVWERGGDVKSGYIKYDVIMVRAKEIGRDWRFNICYNRGERREVESGGDRDVIVWERGGERRYWKTLVFVR